MRPDDEADFEGLVERQWHFAWKVAWAVLRNRQDAEDAAQETFLHVFRARAWRDLRNERAFVARTAWRAAIDRLRQRKTGIHGFAPAAQEGMEDGLALLRDGAPDPESAVVAADWDAAVHRLIDSLPDDLRQPLALSVEMNSREIAEVMGVAEGTVRTRLMRARQMLREKLAAMEERRYVRR